MRFQTATIGVFASLAFAQNAVEVDDNPSGVTFGATLPNLGTTDIRGSLVAQSNPSGVGALFQVSFSGFPSEGGPFLYHIHANDNCETPGGHLDPFGRGDSPSCVSSSPNTCQVGDLSGKHGKINGTSFSANYVDDYVSMVPGTAAYVGNRTVVVHYANKTIITCGVLKQLANGTTLSTATNGSSSTTAGGSGSPTGSNSSVLGGSGSAGPSSSPLTGGASSVVVGTSVMLMGLAALFL
ncbi:hypothetical protein AAFC00_005344 [Neodothiora populina]|uniref:Superoxide dismutase copper/zinc binding domain-containing protein n=1 Tax=Neodothiora populina TaxID=2781224 RepID=A0ABR3PKL9_9PEZI